MVKPKAKKTARQRQHKKTDLIKVRQEKAWKLRVQCKSYREIASKLGVTITQVFRDLEAARQRLSDRTDGYAERERALMLERLELFESKIGSTLQTTKGTQGLSQLAGAYKGISERKSKLLGLDAPTTSKTELTGPEGGPVALTSGDWYQRMLDLGWTPPALKEKQILPGLPAPSTEGEPAPQESIVTTTQVIEVKE